jgi:hypothetical protein
MSVPRCCFVVVVLACLLPVSAAGAGLKITDAGVLSPVLSAGGKSSVKVVVRNAGRKALRGGAVRFFLSPGSKRGKALRGSVKVGRVAGRRTKTVTGHIKLPGKLGAGAYQLRACLKNACPKAGEPIGVLPKPDAPSVSPQVAEGGYPADGVISHNGGSLTAIGADGRFYQLIVPAGALAADERISMKPLASVGGLPFAGGMIAGVQFEPAGLEFSRPAALIISGDGISAAAGQVVFGYNGAGRDLRLSAWFRKPPPWAEGQYDPSKSLVVPVEHFSGVGIAPATDLETARQLRYKASDARDRISQEVADKIARERNRQLTGTDDSEGTDLSGLVESSLTAYLEEVILPEAAAASFSDAMYESAARDIIGWERQRQLLGDESELSGKNKALRDRIDKLMKIAWEKLVERAEKRCYAGDFSIIARILPLERQRQLLGEDRPNEFSEALKRCFKFELRVVGRLEHKGSGGPQGFSGSVDETYELHGTVPLALSGEGLGVLGADLVGTAPFAYTVVQETADGNIDFGFASSTCHMSSTGNTIPGQITVAQGGLGYQISGSDVKRVVKPFLSLDIGDPQEEINSQCNGQAFGQPSSSNENNYERNFLRYWAAAHSEQRANADSSSPDPFGPNPGPWRLELDQKPWPLLGELKVDESNPTYGYHLTETWELVHTPPKQR